jgi:hypothetical protein
MHITELYLYLLPMLYIIRITISDNYIYIQYSSCIFMFSNTSYILNFALYILFSTNTVISKRKVFSINATMHLQIRTSFAVVCNLK